MKPYQVKRKPRPSLASFAMAVLLGAAIVMGCSEANVNPIQGKVTLGGKPYDGLMVYMRPMNPSMNPRSVGIGKTGPDGTLHLDSAAGAGLDEGNYRVSFSLRLNGSNGVAITSTEDKNESVDPSTIKEMVPHPFSSGEESTASFEVKTGDNRFDFDIPSQ